MNLIQFHEKTVKRYENLIAKDCISKESLQQKQEILFDNISRKKRLEYERIKVADDLASCQDRLGQMPVHHQDQIKRMERDIVSLDQEAVRNNTEKSITITALGSGTVTAVNAGTGQTVSPDRPL